MKKYQFSHLDIKRRGERYDKKKNELKGRSFLHLVLNKSFQYQKDLEENSIISIFLSFFCSPFFSLTLWIKKNREKGRGWKKKKRNLEGKYKQFLLKVLYLLQYKDLNRKHSIFVLFPILHFYTNKVYFPSLAFIFLFSFFFFLF